jgi:hypothetical protein
VVVRKRDQLRRVYKMLEDSRGRVDVLFIALQANQRQGWYDEKVVELTAKGIPVPEAKLAAARLIWPGAFTGISARTIGVESEATC